MHASPHSAAHFIIVPLGRLEFDCLLSRRPLLVNHGQKSYFNHVGGGSSWSTVVSWRKEGNYGRHRADEAYGQGTALQGMSLKQCHNVCRR